MTHGSLFSGIGGFDLAAAWAGWTNVFNCEIDPFCRRVLKYHFPESEHMKMFKQQTLPFGEIASTCSPVDSPASHSVSRANVKARPMTATYGPQCLELFDLFSPAGLWARTLTESLIGRRAWSSSRCALTWKRRDMRCKRTLFQLRASVLPICDTELGLLPTVQTQGLKRCVNRKTEFMPLGLLSTPTACDAKNNSFPPSQTKRKSGVVHDVMISYPSRIGKGSRLSPRYVAQMMGFPPDWTELPFRHGAKDRSKLTATR